MKTYLLYAASGPMVVVTDRPSITDSEVVSRLEPKGIDKFLAFDLPLESTRARYQHHYEAVLGDGHEDDHLRILDTNGFRIFHLFDLSDLGEPTIWEPEETMHH